MGASTSASPLDVDGGEPPSAATSDGGSARRRRLRAVDIEGREDTAQHSHDNSDQTDSDRMEWEAPAQRRMQTREGVEGGEGSFEPLSCGVRQDSGSGSFVHRHFSSPSLRPVLCLYTALSTAAVARYSSPQPYTTDRPLLNHSLPVVAALKPTGRAAPTPPQR